MIVFEGRKYYVDRATCYYKSLMRGADREYLHRAVWRKTYGNIPHGWDVHHKVEDRGTVNPDDLACMPMKEHLKIHIETLRANGRATIHNTRRLREFVCEGCGKTYLGVKKPINRWCSKQCANNFWNRLNA